MTRSQKDYTQQFRIVHELPQRLRIKSNRLWDPTLDVDYVVALLESHPSVTSARINIAAASIIVEHTGAPDIKEDLLASLNALPHAAFMPDPFRDNSPDMMEVGARGAAAAVTPVLPMPVKAALSWFLAAPSILEGLDTLFSEGLKIEVLDATTKIFALMRRDYFTANAVGALIALGGYMENATERKTNDLLKSLIQPEVETITVERNGLETRIPYAETMIGDIVVCGTGQLVPVDGLVHGGEASVNMSAITGESVPVHFQPGDEIKSGGVVEDGKLKIKAEKVGADTNVSRIGGYIEKSLRNKSKTQKSSEELADKLVPLTFGAGLALYLLTGDLARAASVLTVDYSCAIKLSTPVAVRSAMYAAGQHGVILKGAQALDQFARADTMVFDKTGTLTRGELHLTDVSPLTDIGENELLALAAGAEEHYAHPVAKAVVKAAHERGLELPAFSQVDFIVAHGVSAMIDNSQVLVGSRHFIHDDEQIDCSFADNEAEKLHSQGKSLLYVARDGKLIGIIGMRDALRPEARDTLRQLKELGISRLVMLTGDHSRMAEAIKAELPELDEVRAELAPEDKAAIIEQLHEEGRSVAFLGDGVNDAPALITADVGICMPTGADLARETAQVLLMKEDIRGLVEARKVALKVDATLKQCLWSSVGINSTLFILAGAGLIPAVVSAAVHNASTIGILGYAGLRSVSGTNGASVPQLAAETGIPPANSQPLSVTARGESDAHSC